MKVFKYMLLFFIVSSCQTIVFTKGKGKSQDVDEGKWHHSGGIFGLVEFSDPYDPQKKCKKWKHVTTDNSFMTGLVSNITYIGLWTPRVVGVKCAK